MERQAKLSKVQGIRLRQLGPENGAFFVEITAPCAAAGDTFE
jgi:hypothetical protein